jgi:hypothetical protein
VGDDGAEQGGFFVPSESLTTAILHRGKELDLFVGDLRLKIEHDPRM